MIYCDLDGVLADFDGTYHKNNGVWPREESRVRFWEKIEKTENFWLHLNKMPDADMLLNYLKNFEYQILTGCPATGFEKAESEKKEWVKRHIGAQMPVICCLSKDKTLYCKKDDILIDDWPENITAWQQAGGIGIMHTSAEQTIQRLQQLGYMPENLKTGPAQSITAKGRNLSGKGFNPQNDRS